MINHVASNIGQIKKMTSQLKFKCNVDFNTGKRTIGCEYRLYVYFSRV